MSDDPTRDDIRTLLKTFGIGADEAIMEHLKSKTGDEPLRLRVILEEVDVPSGEREIFSLDGEVRR